MYYEVTGQQDEPAVLLIAGLGGSANYWRPQMDAFAGRFRVIVYDQVGTGRTGGDVAAGYTVDDMAVEARDLLAGLGVSKCHVVGHALGGLVALAMARNEPALVDRLVLINAWAKMDQHTVRCFAARLALLDHAGIDAYVEAQPIFIYPAWWMSAHAGFVEEEVRHAAQHFPGRTTVLRRIEALKAFDFRDHAASLKHRTLVVSARDDILVPSTASETLATLLPNARCIEMPYGGHACTVTSPEEFNDACLTFLSSTQA